MDNAWKREALYGGAAPPPASSASASALTSFANSPPSRIAIPGLSRRTSFCSNFCILGCNGSDGAGISGGQHREAGSRELGGARR